MMDLPDEMDDEDYVDPKSMAMPSMFDLEDDIAVDDDKTAN